MINTWFKFEGKIQNNIAFTRNHKDADDDDENNMSPPSQGGGGDIIKLERVTNGWNSRIRTER